MVKRTFAFGLAACLFAAPSLALADVLTPVQIQIEHLTAIVAALQAQENALSGQTLACATFASKTTVAADEPFFLAWGSVGALAPGSVPAQSMWPQNGVSTMDIQQAGTWTYDFTFYAASGATTTCAQKIVVEPAQ